MILIYGCAPGAPGFHPGQLLHSSVIYKLSETVCMKGVSRAKNGLKDEAWCRIEMACNAFFAIFSHAKWPDIYWTGALTDA